MVEVTTLDEHYLYSRGYVRRPRASVSAVAGRCTENGYLIALGFESGNVQLFSERYDDQCSPFSRDNGSVFSVAVAEKVLNFVSFGFAIVTVK